MKHGVMPLPSKLKVVIDLLCDGNCYSQSELKNLAQLSEDQTSKVIAFLVEYGFVNMSNENEKLRITQTAKKLFAK